MKISMGHTRETVLENKETKREVLDGVASMVIYVNFNFSARDHSCIAERNNVFVCVHTGIHQLGTKHKFKCLSYQNLPYVSDVAALTA